MSSSLSAASTVNVTAPPNCCCSAAAAWFSDTVVETAFAALDNSAPKLKNAPRSCPSTGTLALNPALPIAWNIPGSAATASRTNAGEIVSSEAHEPRLARFDEPEAERSPGQFNCNV